MRIIPFLVSLLFTAALIFFLDNQWGKLPPLGKFLSPQHGFWQNAEPVDKSFTGELSLPGLKDRASVYFDQYLIPTSMPITTRMPAISRGISMRNSVSGKWNSKPSPPQGD